MSEAGWVRNLLMDCSPPLPLSPFPPSRLVPTSSLPLCFSSSKFTLGQYASPRPLNPLSKGLDSSLFFLSLSLALAELLATYAHTPSRLLFFVLLLPSFFFLRVARRIWSIHQTVDRLVRSRGVHRVLENYVYKLGNSAKSERKEKRASPSQTYSYGKIWVERGNKEDDFSQINFHGSK